MLMSYETALEYSESISSIEAQEALVMMKIITHPHTKAEEQKKTHKAYHKIAFAHQQKQAMTSEQLEQFFKLKGVM